MQKVIPFLKFAKALSNYHISLQFEDGVSGIVDLSGWKGKGVFKFWDKEENFKAFTITPEFK